MTGRHQRQVSWSGAVYEMPSVARSLDAAAGFVDWLHVATSDVQSPRPPMCYVAPAVQRHHNALVYYPISSIGKASIELFLQFRQKYLHRLYDWTLV